jgi:CRP-like cAMP-binding protein
MTENQHISSLLQNLDERTKELNCIYLVDEALNDFDSDIDTVLKKVIDIIPSGWRFTEICKAKITFEEAEICSEGYKDTDLKLYSKITTDNKAVGEISVAYIKPIKTEKRIFLPEEITLLNTIAAKLSNFFLLKKLRLTIKQMEEHENGRSGSKEDDLSKWLKELGLIAKEISDFTRVEIRFKKGETMCKQGSLTSYIMLLAEGLSKNSLEGSQERGFNFSIVKPFDFIGLSSLYASTTYYFSGSALTPCKVFIIENNIFRQAIESNPAFAQNIFKWYCKTTERHLKRLSCIANKQALGRMAEILLYLKEDIFGSSLIKNYISRKDIAELAAMSTESAVRILSDLKKDGIINIVNNNDIEILNEKILRTLSIAG